MYNTHAEIYIYIYIYIYMYISRCLPSAVISSSFIVTETVQHSIGSLSSKKNLCRSSSSSNIYARFDNPTEMSEEQIIKAMNA